MGEDVTYLDLHERESICMRILGVTVISGVGWFYPEENDGFRAGDYGVLRPIPPFTNINDFELITKAMFAKGFNFNSCYSNYLGVEGEWDVAFTTDKGEFKYSHPNLTTATAKAALLAMYGKVLR